LKLTFQASNKQIQDNHLYMVGYQLDDFKFLYIEIWLDSTISIHFTLVVMGPFQERTKSFRRLDSLGLGVSS